MKKALLIGIDYVNTPDVSLRGCINDIIIMRNMLIDAYDYESGDITILRDDASDFIIPTKNNILEQINLLANTSKNLEEIWFHYSGHGSQIHFQNSNNNTNSTTFSDVIIPSNYREEGFILDTDILSALQKIQCRVIMIFDCCHSGSICDMPWSFSFSNNSVSTSKTNKVQIENQHIYVLSGCRDNETSADSSNILDQAVGAFSNALVESLRDSHHNITIMDLYKKTCVFLINNGYSQNPLFSSSSQEPNYLIKKLFKN